jgi:hypothetical protein
MVVLALEHGVQEILTLHGDFTRFPAGEEPEALSRLTREVGLLGRLKLGSARSVVRGWPEPVERPLSLHALLFLAVQATPLSPRLLGGLV